MYDDLAIIIPVYIPNERYTIMKSLENLKDYNIYVPWNGVIEDYAIINLIDNYATSIQVINSKSKAENINKVLDILPSNIKYILILDADSIPNIKTIKFIYDDIKKSPSHIGWIQGNYRINRGKNITIRNLDDVERLFTSNMERISNYIGIKNGFAFKGHDAIFKRKVLEEADGFDPSKLSEDTDMTFRLNALGYKGGFCPIYESSSEACPSWKIFYRQRLRWIQGMADLSIMPKLLLLGNIILLIFLFLYPLQIIIILLFFYLSLSDIRGVLLIPNILIRVFISIVVILGYGPKSFVASERNVSSSNGARLKVNIV